MTVIQEKAKLLQARIFTEEYYETLFCKVLVKHNMSTASIDKHESTDRQLVKMFNDFWMLLPDSPIIRQGPFFELCDICEEIYDFE
jgi:hypothetical protein